MIKSFDTVDMGILDRVLSSLGLPGFFRHAYFEYHAPVRFKLAAGLGQPWTRDRGIPQGCPLSMMCIVALYLPWCRFLAAHEGVQPQLYADNRKCVSEPHDLFEYCWVGHHSLSPYQCTSDVLEECHFDFRDRLPDVDPNGAVQLQATSQVALEYHRFARLDRQRCYSVQFFKFYHVDSIVAHSSAKYVVVEPRSCRGGS